MNWRLLPAGERAVLVEVADLDAVLRLDATLSLLVEAGEEPWSAVVDRVPAARTLLVTVNSPRALRAVVAGVRDVLAGVHFEAAFRPLEGPNRRLEVHTPGPHTPGPEGELVEVGVHYDGPDLAEVARITGLNPAEVVTAHTQQPWRVGFGGFSPGFAYLVGGDPRLAVPRRSEPRTAVPAGAVGLAGEFSAVYPRATPGGWQLIGHTDAVVWDAARPVPALLRPGRWVRFVDLGGRR